MKTLLFLDAGPLGQAAITQFQTIASRMGMKWTAIGKGPEALVAADWIVGWDRVKLDPVVRAHDPAIADRVEYWPGGQAELEEEVADLVARLFRGGLPRVDRPKLPPPPPPNPVAAPTKGAVVRISRETKGRAGKGVTILSDIPLTGEPLKELATLLKQRCGTGGTVKDGRIEIQGDQRDRLAEELTRLGYKVKRAGG